MDSRVGWGRRKGGFPRFLCPGHGVSLAPLEDEEKRPLGIEASRSGYGETRKPRKLAQRPPFNIGNKSQQTYKQRVGLAVWFSLRGL